MKKRIILLLAALSFLACEETIELDLDQVETQIVIESLITNELKQHTITITESVDFYQDGNTPRTSNATILVTDNENQSWSFSESTEQAGLYVSDEAFAGKVGNQYNLEVNIDGETYTATDEMLRVTTIDSVTWTIDEEEREDPSEEGLFYDFLLYTTEPQATQDFYLFKFYRNDTIQNFDNTEIFFSNDEFIGERIEGIDAPTYYRKGDKAKVEMFSISREAFVFYADVSNILNNDGGMFGPVPANPRSNIKGGALGLFQVSAVAKDSLVVGE